MKESKEIFQIIYETLNSEENQLSVSMLCQTAGVSRSGYYAWLKAADTRRTRELQDRKDFELILEAFNKRGYSKGAKSIYMALIHRDKPVVMNLKKIRRLMAKYRLYCPIRKANPYRRLAQALRSNNVADNLLNREFEKYGPRHVLLTDITYIPYNGTFAYLSTILDAFTKEILSYVLSPSLEEDFVLETLEILVSKHGPSLSSECMVHSDQGYHYTCRKFIEMLSNKSFRQSMSRKGNCWDNAPQESFFGHMKDHLKEKVRACKTFSQVQEIIDDYMDYYNNERYQWNLAKLSPAEFYKFCTTGEYPLKLNNPPKPQF